MHRRFLVVLTIFLISTRSAWSVAPLHPENYPHPPKDNIHHPSTKAIARYGYLRAASLSVSTGTVNVAVLIVQFPAGTGGVTSGSRSIQSLPTIDAYYSGQRNYYTEASYNLLHSTFTFFGSNICSQAGCSSAVTAGAMTLAHPMEYYGCGDEGPGSGSPCPAGVTTPHSTDGGANGNFMIRDAIAQAVSAGYSQLQSKDNGGHFDAIAVMHAGNGNETSSGTNGDIWSIFYSQDPQIIGGQGVPGSPFADQAPQAQALFAGFEEGDVVPETETSGYSPLGVMCHEFGHTLGLPDLYDTETGASVVGYWELMDLGPYDGFGANPAHPSAWDKIALGWITPTVITTKTNISLNAVEITPEVVKLPVQNGSAGEYFLAEYRRRSSGTYDQDIPGDGLLIWHVDDAIAIGRGINITTPGVVPNSVNTGRPHNGVSIVTADGVQLSGSSRGDAANAFQNGSHFSSPKSDGFGGQPSGINLVNIAGVGTPTVTSQAINLAVGSNQSILRVATYPDPAGKNYPHPSGPGHATFQFQLTRPANEFSINIYTLGANLVRKINQGEITVNTDRSGNDKWVYEYIWDLTNGDGAMVAPGVYFYVVRADGLSDRGKMVVIR